MIHDYTASHRVISMNYVGIVKYDKGDSVARFVIEDNKKY